MNYRQQMNLITTHLGKITKLYHDCAKSQGISYNTMTVLYALHQSQPCTQKKISEEWGLPKQSVNTIIRDFQKKGYIELLTGSNKKEKLVIFTDKGNTFANEILEPILAMEERILQRIGEEESRQVENTMAKFADIFSEEFLTYEKNYQS